jgi:Domain of unknown function (DUF4214)
VEHSVGESKAPVPMTASLDTFADVYAGVIASAMARVARRDPRAVRMFEPVEVAELCCRRVPLADLLGIESDDDFVISCYAKFLDRLPARSEVDHFAHKLSTGEQSRPELITEISESEEHRRRGIRVNLV